MIKVLSTVAMLSALIAPSLDCNSPPTPPITPTPVPVEPTDVDDCGGACSRMQSLGCREGGDVLGPNGTRISCEAFCRYELRNNRVPLNPSCVKTITSCDQIETKCAVGRTRF